MRVSNLKNNCGVEFPSLQISIFLNLSKIYSTEIFPNFRRFFFCVIKRFLSKKYGVTGLVFKIDSIDGKEWVKPVAMQQHSATLIYDLNTKKQWRVSLKNGTAIQNKTVPSLRNLT